MFIPDEILQSILKTYASIFGRAEIRGHFRLPEGPKVITANHTLTSDTFHLPPVLDEKPHFLMQRDLFDMPRVSPLLKLAGPIPVKQNGTQSKDSMVFAYKALNEGKTIEIFPEGELVQLDRFFIQNKGDMLCQIFNHPLTIPI